MEVGYQSGKRTISGEGLGTTQASIEIQYGHFQQNKTADLERGLRPLLMLSQNVVLFRQKGTTAKKTLLTLSQKVTFGLPKKGQQFWTAPSYPFFAKLLDRVGLS